MVIFWVVVDFFFFSRWWWCFRSGIFLRLGFSIWCWWAMVFFFLNCILGCGGCGVCVVVAIGWWQLCGGCSSGFP